MPRPEANCNSLTRDVHHPGGNPGANRKSISYRCHPILVAFVWDLTYESIDFISHPGLPPGWYHRRRRGCRRLGRCAGAPRPHPVERAHSCMACAPRVLCVVIAVLRAEAFSPGRLLRTVRSVGRMGTPTPTLGGELRTPLHSRRRQWRCCARRGARPALGFRVEG